MLPVGPNKDLDFGASAPAQPPGRDAADAREAERLEAVERNSYLCPRCGVRTFDPDLVTSKRCIRCGRDAATVVFEDRSDYCGSRECEEDPYAVYVSPSQAVGACRFHKAYVVEHMPDHVAKWTVQGWKDHAAGAAAQAERERRLKELLDHAWTVLSALTSDAPEEINRAAWEKESGDLCHAIAHVFYGRDPAFLGDHPDIGPCRLCAEAGPHAHADGEAG